jgi:hypothetical protein
MQTIDRIIENLTKLRESSNTLELLLDMERVLDQLDIYTYKNWYAGELVEGPLTSRYFVTASFMWPKQMTPDNRVFRKFRDYGIITKLTEDTLNYTVRPQDYDDFEPGSFMPKTESIPVWVVELRVPKELMQEVKTGYAEIEGQQVDLQDLDKAYENDLDKETVKNDEQDQLA